MTSQIVTRKFAVNPTVVKQFPREVNGIPTELLERYRDRIMRCTEMKRKYEQIGSCARDNLWELEILGMGMYAREYSIVIDLSNLLDLILHLTFQCRPEDSRSIRNYDKVSSYLLRYEIKDTDNTLGDIFKIPRMVEAYTRFINDLNANLVTSSLSSSEKLSKILFSFYVEILSTAGRVRDYVAVSLLREYSGHMVYRSKTFSFGILTSDVPMADDVIVHTRGGMEFVIPVRSYRQYGWIKEGILFEADRNS